MVLTGLTIESAVSQASPRQARRLESSPISEVELDRVPVQFGQRRAPADPHRLGEVRLPGRERRFQALDDFGILGGDVHLLADVRLQVELVTGEFTPSSLAKPLLAHLRSCVRLSLPS